MDQDQPVSIQCMVQGRARNPSLANQGHRVTFPGAFGEREAVSGGIAELPEHEPGAADGSSCYHRERACLRAEPVKENRALKILEGSI